VHQIYNDKVIYVGLIAFVSVYVGLIALEILKFFVYTQHRIFSLRLPGRACVS